MNAKTLFAKSDEEQIISAIAEAENQTSGEIRLHVEDKCKSKDPMKRAKELFGKLGMHKTEKRNGVLIYLAVKDHLVCIFGDEGIHEKVGQEFWDEDIEILVQHFKENSYADGLTEVIGRVGNKLKEFFPVKDDDKNELSDEISFG